MAMGRREDPAPHRVVDRDERAARDGRASVLSAAGSGPRRARLRHVRRLHCASFSPRSWAPESDAWHVLWLLLIGYFEGIGSERGIAWRTADSLALSLVGAGPEKCRRALDDLGTRRLIDLETPRAVFTWILRVLATTDLIKGKTIRIERTLEADAALRSIVRPVRRACREF